MARSISLLFCGSHVFIKTTLLRFISFSAVQNRKKSGSSLKFLHPLMSFPKQPILFKHASKKKIDRLREKSEKENEKEVFKKRWREMMKWVKKIEGSQMLTAFVNSATHAAFFWRIPGARKRFPFLKPHFCHSHWFHHRLFVVISMLSVLLSRLSGYLKREK